MFRNKKKGLDPLVPRLLRQVHAAAEGSEERGSASLPLLRHAEDLVAAAVALLSEVGRARQNASGLVALQLECLQVLRLHLLPCRAYAARVPGATLGPLLGFCRGFLQSLEPSAEGRTFFSPASSVLQLALEGFQGSLDPAERCGLLEFFTEFLGKKVPVEETRLAYTLLAALNAFLACEGAGAAPFAVDVHRACRGFLMGLWKSSYTQRTFEELVVYSHLQVRLGGLGAEGAREFLGSLWGWVRQYSGRSGGVEKHGSAVLLSSALYARGFPGGPPAVPSSSSEGGAPSTSAVSASEGEDDDDIHSGRAFVRHPKRPRLGASGTPPRGEDGLLRVLFEDTVKSPDVWGPILCMFLRQRRRDLGPAIVPPDLASHWVGTLSSDVAVIFGGSTISGQKTGLHYIWILRVLICLAKTSGASSGDASQAAGAPSRAHWKRLAQYLMEWLPRYHVQASKYTNVKHSSDFRKVLWDALHLVAYLFASGLVQPFRVPAELLALETLRKNMGSQEPLMLMVAVASSSSSVAEKLQTPEESSRPGQNVLPESIFASLRSAPAHRVPGMARFAPRALLAAIGFPLSQRDSQRAVFEASDELEGKWISRDSCSDRAHQASCIPLGRALPGVAPAPAAAHMSDGASTVTTLLPARVDPDESRLLESLWESIFQPLAAALAGEASGAQLTENKACLLPMWMAVVAQTHLCLSQASPVTGLALDAVDGIFCDLPMEVFTERLCTQVLDVMGDGATAPHGLELLRITAEAASRGLLATEASGSSKTFFMETFAELSGALVSEMEAHALAVQQKANERESSRIPPQDDDDLDALLDVDMPTAPTGRRTSSTPFAADASDDKNLGRSARGGGDSNTLWKNCVQGFRDLVAAAPTICYGPLESLLRMDRLPLGLQMDVDDLAYCLASSNAPTQMCARMPWRNLSSVCKEAMKDEESHVRLLDLLIRLVGLCSDEPEGRFWASHGSTVLKTLQATSENLPETVLCLTKFVEAVGTVLIAVPQLLEGSEKARLEKDLLWQLRSRSFMVRKVAGDWVAQLVGQSPGLGHSLWTFLPGLPFKPRVQATPAYVWVGGASGGDGTETPLMSVQTFETSMLCLAGIMQKSEDLEALSLFVFCVNLVRNAPKQEADGDRPGDRRAFGTALGILGDVASSHGYLSSGVYVSRHLGFIVWHWVAGGLQWELLRQLYYDLSLDRVTGAGWNLLAGAWSAAAMHPSRAFDHDAVAAFVTERPQTNDPFASCVAALFSRIAAQESGQSQSSYGTQPQNLVDRDIPVIWETYRKNWQHAMENYGPGIGGEPQNWAEALAMELPNVVAKILCSVSASGTPLEPLLSKACACDALLLLAAQLRTAGEGHSNGAWLSLRPMQLAHVLWTVESELECRKSLQHKRALFWGLDALVKTAVDPDSLNVYTFPHICTLLLKGLRDGSTEDIACLVLSNVVDRLFGSSPQEEKLEVLLKPVIAHITESLLLCLEKQPHDRAPLPAFKILRKVVAECPIALRPYIPPFPRYGWLEKLRQWQERSMESVSLKNRILPLATVFGLELRTWRNCIEEWTRVLKEERLQNTSASSAEDDELVWQLLHAFKQQRDPTIQDMLMCLVAHVGLRGSNVTAIRPAHARTSEHLSPSAADPGRLTLMVDSVTQSVWQTLVQRRDYRTRREAFLTLTRIFTNSATRTILGGSGEEDRPISSGMKRPAEIAELQAFFQDSNKGVPCPSASAARRQVPSPIFKSAGQEMSVSGLVQDIILYIRGCQDIAPRNLLVACSLLSDCCGLTTCCDQFAEALLPHTLITLSLFEMHDEFPQIRRIRAALGEAIGARILRNNSYPPHQLIVILESLEALRKFRQYGLQVKGSFLCDASTWLRPNTVGESHFWLDLSYLDFAEASLRCSAYSTTFLYIEEWVRSQGFAQIHVLPESQDKSRAQNLLREASLRAGEPDTLYCLTSSADPHTQIQFLMHEGRWHDALQSLDILQQSHDGANNNRNISAQVVRCLQGLGCPNLLEVCLAGLPAAPGDLWAIRDIQYEAAWRMSKWDLESVDQAETMPGGRGGSFNKGLLSCLSLLSAGQHERVKALVNTVRQGVVREWASCVPESCSLLNAYVCKVRLLQMVDVAAGATAPAQLPKLLSDREYARLKGDSDAYSQWEPMMTLSQIILQERGLTASLEEHLFKCVKLSRRAGELQDASSALQALKNMHNATGVQDVGTNGMGSQNPLQTSKLLEISLQDAKLLWAKGLHDAAVFVAQQVLAKVSAGVREPVQAPPTSVAMYARGSCLLASWLDAAATESSEMVYECFQRAANMAEKCAPSRQGALLCKTNFELAQFAYQQVRQIKEQVESPEWQAHIKLMKSRQDILEHIGQSREAGKARHYLNQQERFQRLDAEEVEDLDSNLGSFALCAIRSYGKCLANGEKHDLHAVFRLVRLWFSHKGDVAQMNAAVSAALKDVPSHKFLRLAYQLASQVSLPPRGSGKRGTVTFQGVLSGLVEKLAFEHPYHILPKIFAISAGDQGQKGAGASGYAHDTDKVKAANALLKKFSTHDAQTFEVWSQMKMLIDAYEAIAAASVVKDGRGNPTPPVLHRSARDIGKRTVVSAVPVLSTSVPVFQDARYRTPSRGLVVPHMVRFENEVCLVGGINCPKKVIAIDSEGISHAQLVKSNDDMRQDAVMQQVFGVANDLLRQDPATRKRTLSMVRYNVVPFSPSSGLVEWVNDTTPISDYLYGKAATGGRSARACYRECARTMQDVADSRDLDMQRKAYENCLQKFRPSMNRFFLENFLEPAVWFERRLAYTRSVAVSSIVGHIVGLGDRHLSNILIRNDTAEVVHIDLGIAFDQGQVLKYPERVPFRLTPNIVDGMGVCGVEGVMRRCCQETLRVLRLNRDSLMTVIEVFVHDPLYAWALSPVQALRKQAQEGRFDQEPRAPGGGGSGLGALGETADAQRVLQRVRRKLEGNEKGQILEVQGQVQHLFREAQSKDNLCQMYCGWGAWV